MKSWVNNFSICCDSIKDIFKERYRILILRKAIYSYKISRKIEGTITINNQLSTKIANDYNC